MLALEVSLAASSAVIWTRIISWVRRVPTSWVVAAVLVLAAVQLPGRPAALDGYPSRTNRLAFPARKEKPASPEADPFPALPKAASVNRRDLPPAFTKSSPVTLADLKAMEQYVKALVTRVSPAVVAVSIGNDNGSGVVISSNGLVLTAGHVSGKANRDVRFTFSNGRVVRGKTLGSDLESDTGLLQITDSGSWPCARLGDLNQARVGNWVLALGHPGGFDVRRSLVVRFGRIIRLGEDSLQSDCTISPGDSGGPLFDMYGRVIGIHNAISSSTAENFHVTINAYAWNWDRLVQTAHRVEPAPPSAYAGVAGVDTPEGYCLTAVETNSPAARAGLKVGDLVMRIDGREIKASATFQRWIDEAQPGDELSIEVKRGGHLLSVPIRLEPAPRRQ